MLLINFSHPLTPEQQTQIEAITASPLARILTVTTQFDNQQPYLPQLGEDDYIGGLGSRGSGKIKFINLQIK